jgi:serine protease Do
MTNQHVIENGRTYTITLSDGSRYTGNAISLVALPKERTIDLALMLVEDRAEKIIPSLPIGDYNSIVQGSEVVAFGHPSGLDFTVTRGVVSALRENLFIQTDAAINPGNSGGPLISRTGQLIGINTFVASNTQGIGFALRADYALTPDLWNTFEDMTPLWNELLNSNPNPIQLDER